MFYVFMGDDYYPAGGVDDFVGMSEDLAGAVRLVATNGMSQGFEWWQIADADMKEVSRDDIFKRLGAVDLPR